MIVCIDCQKEFEFSASEEKYYQEKGFQNPKRCKSCRQVKKQKQYENEGKYDFK